MHETISAPKWVLVESVAIREENGVRYMQFVVGTMKKLHGSLAKVDAAWIPCMDPLHGSLAKVKQRIVECSEARFFAIDAHNKLVDMLPSKSGPLVRRVSYNSKEVGEKAAGYGMFRGVAKWVGTVLNCPKMVPKDIGRREVIAKLVHAGLPNAGIAKYIYHIPYTL